MSPTTTSGVTLRPYLDEDESAVIDVLNESLGGGPAGRRPPEFFRWKHIENPFGRSYILLAEVDGDLAGVRAFMRWRFVRDGRVIEAARAVDTATHPKHQGRGIFRSLTISAIESLEADTDLIFNTPNEKSLPGYLKMGWETVGRVPIAVRVRRPLRFVRHLRSFRSLAAPGGRPPSVEAPTAAVALSDARLERLITGLRRPPGVMQTPYDPRYLRWRYARAPMLDYRVVEETRAGELMGLGIFRVRPRGTLWESTIAELLVADDDVSVARSLLKRVGRAADVDHVASHFTPGGALSRTASRAGYVPAPAGMTLVVNPLRPMANDPTDLTNWSFSLGDLEVF